MNASQSTKILITVMTYPHPSVKSRESVCVAGINENHEWIRLYPVVYRYMPENQRFRKYQWIEVNTESSGSSNDNRLESRKPDLSTIKLIGEPLSTQRDWQARRNIIDKMPHYTKRELERLYEIENRSLGIVRPSQIIDLVVEKSEDKWKPEWELMYRQGNLFGDPPKPLRKIPYKFSYVFECPDSDTAHQAMITDWELGVLFLKESQRLGSDDKAAQSVRAKFLTELCADSKDTRFFMGTTFPFNSWIVLGVFWPPKTPPQTQDLFNDLG